MNSDFCLNENHLLDLLLVFVVFFLVGVVLVVVFGCPSLGPKRTTIDCRWRTLEEEEEEQ